ncbi:MAG: NAD(P)-dependent oxidoreductase [Phenylobacterium sp.]|uniref:NAD-dependent epimerase/dehydratase family protein n=1 Tax=Phenylobacterium sp. TaxID=1871053 RepID=UPI0025F3DDE3|nr:NAD(P)-dependent oxidoreductase [Phenylobacterium sp.]MCA3722997.1 NAD(P)-dependent oxidoreductase [Phenylobacterium sp.]MCA6253574.1 NAD(P)-dependent oxidoreductase [Phenylobacterium sp.]
MARILLTGASSFTGLWIAEALAAACHEVVAPLTRQADGYPGLRGERVARLSASAARVFEAPLDSDRFRDLARTGGFDLFAHHGADIPGYRSPDYDVAAGVARNLAGAGPAVRAAADGGCRVLISTATVFEPGEGGEGPDAPAVSPYGLSKGLTGQALAGFAEEAGLSFGRFVIANPFGVLEEGRMGWSLFQAWFRGEPGRVLTPAYVRDNQPAPHLADAYVRLAGRLLESDRPVKLDARPSGLVGTQGDFAKRLAAEAGPRLGLACDLVLNNQVDFPEPRVRVNDEPCLPSGWRGEAFFDAYTDYYARLAAEGRFNGPA